MASLSMESRNASDPPVPSPLSWRHWRRHSSAQPAVHHGILHAPVLLEGYGTAYPALPGSAQSQEFRRTHSEAQHRELPSFLGWSRAGRRDIKAFSPHPWIVPHGPAATSDAPVAKLGVRLKQAADLPNRSEGVRPISDWDPYAVVTCEGKRFKSRVIAKSATPVWDEFFVFDIENLLDATLRIAVFDDIRCCRAGSLGSVTIRVLDLAHNASAQGEACWHTLTSPSWHREGEACGRVQLQLYYVSERIHRPLKMLCGTWNMGNAAPPQNLSSWLDGVDTLQHDLVAIGLQECHHKLGGRVPADMCPDLEVGCNAAAHLETAMQTHCGGGGSTAGTASISVDAVSVETAVQHCSSGAGLLTLGSTMPLPVSEQTSSYAHQPTSVVEVPGEADDADELPPYAQARPSNNGGRHKTLSLGDIRRKVTGGFQKGIEQLFKAAIGPAYYMVQAVHMGQIRLLIFARNDVVPAISRVTCSAQPTGAPGITFSKGGVGIALSVWDTQLCFINCHLAAHQDKVKARNAAYSSIVAGLKLASHGMDALTAFHHTFWMGDLNYRLDYGQQAVQQPALSPTAEDFKSMVDLVEKCAYPALQPLDQLAGERKAGRAFLSFDEAPLDFPPTFKVKRHQLLQYNCERSPAWCDRVLWRSSLLQLQAVVLRYFAATHITSSDHKPVGAMFEVPTVWLTPVRQGSPTASLTITLKGISATDLLHVAPSKVQLQPFLDSKCLPNPMVEGRLDTMSGKPVVVRGATCAAACSHAWQQPLVLHLKKVPLQDISNHSVMLRILDRSAVTSVDSGVVERGRWSTCLALGRLPLHLLAQELADAGAVRSVQLSAPFTVPLEHQGLHAGTLCGIMELKATQHVMLSEDTWRAWIPLPTLGKMLNPLATSFRRASNT